jgi:tryptophanyl-tRNA synthetase
VENYTQYGKLKTDTGAAVAAMLEPIRARYEQLKGDPGELSRLLRIGAERAQGVAATTLDRAYRAIGLAPR